MSNSGVFGPTPPGVNLSETQDHQIFSSVIALMCIGTLAIGIRVAARTSRTGQGLAFDDYMCILGLLFAHGTAICCLVIVGYGGGRHLWTLTAEEFVKVWQVLFAYVMVYATGVSFTKFSILMFYRRIFGDQIRISLWICSFFVIGYWVTVCVTILVACRPIPYFWTRYTDPTAVGTCIDVPSFFFGNGIAAMLIDVMILVVPIPVVNSLNMHRGQKKAVIGILLLGGFVCIASIVRIVAIDQLIKATDLTWAMSSVFIWSCCEPFIGIVCACLPTFAPLFRRWWTTVATKTGKGSNSGHDLHSVNDKLPTVSNFSIGGKRPWGKLGGGHDGSFGSRDGGLVSGKLRPDDEIELTNEISSGQPRAWGGEKDSVKSTEDQYGAANAQGKNIMVKHDVRWTSTRVDDAV